ncbi:hypothetical protein MHY29_02560 [Micrococcus sp. ACRRV]|uniref:hypothetical protein n=1 Tax=Micrococcus sp. ACRRV TaxID=2918203 RepID=UPI001EF3A966|nr:hypothetical protein [Micrococcus sp. ACRRV]MCG7421732.1 hypothetical protein [Micrococcus sp. ACRRV]
MTSHAQGRVLYLSVGSRGHGVVNHGLLTAEALAQAGLDVESLHTEDATGFVGLAPVLARAREARRAVHVDVTDSLFGPSPAAAADTLSRILPEGATVTLHDVPQPAEGEARFLERAEAYVRIAQAAAGVVVSSEHERALLHAIVDVDAHVVPLPVEDRRAAREAVRLPEALEGLDRDVVIFGHLYPGKGHAEAIDALAELDRQWGPSPHRPRRVTALGAVAARHEFLVDELTARAEVSGLQFRVTGFVPDGVLDPALRAAAVPLAAHHNVSASGSLASWMSVGRRPIVPAGRYTQEMARLRPGTLRIVQVGTSGPEYALAEAVAEAVEEPSRTWQARGTSLAPGPRACARMLAAALADVHGWAWPR